MFKEEILEILHNIGIYIEDIELDYKIEDMIEDSLSFISFFIELENKYNVEFPEVFFEEMTYQKTLLDIKNYIETLKVV